MTKSQNMKAVRSGMRSGFTMVELMLVLLVGGILILAGVQGYKKIYIPTQAEADVKLVGFVIGGVERQKNTMNGGAYQSQATAGAITGELRLALGGATAIADLAGWTYACTAGPNATVTIKTPVYTNTDKRDLVISGINNQHSPWSAANSAGAITITLASVPCAA